MRKLLVTLAASAAAITGFGGAAHAAYPPADGGGTITLRSIESDCKYVNDRRVATTFSATFDYKIIEVGVVLQVVDDTGKILYGQKVPLGTGSVTFTQDTDGLDRLLEVDGTVILYTSGVRSGTAPFKLPCKIESNSGDPDAKLPATGLDSGGLALIALAFTASGIALVGASRRRPADNA